MTLGMVNKGEGEGRKTGRKMEGPEGQLRWLL